MRHNITSVISESGTAAARTFACKILAEGEVKAENILNPVESQEVREIAAQYVSLFEHGCRAKAQDYLPILSASLFRLFFEKSWKEIEPIASDGADLTIASEIPEVLLLPWELVRFPSAVGAALGFDERFSIRRLPQNTDRHSVFSAKIPSGPLRVLFMACEPLDFEQEERLMEQAAEGVDMVLQIGETGSLQELQILAAAFRPQVVQLAGELKTKNGQPFFSFQGEGGRPDLKSAEELAAALANCGVQCIVLSGCQSKASSSLDFFCQRLARSHFLAVAWNATSDMILPFYKAVSLGKTVDEALGALRREWQAFCQKHGCFFAYPVLYASHDQLLIFNPQEKDVAFGDFTIDREQRPLPGMTEGYCNGFVDRRKDLQRLASALSEGMVRSLIITGNEGTGKSVLATRLAGTMAPLGFSPLSIYSSPDNPLSAVRVLEAVIVFMMRTGQLDAAQRLKNPESPLADRLKIMLDLLNNGRFLILLDSLDLDDKTDRIKDPMLADIYPSMIREMDGSRLIITCRTLPSDAMTLPGRAWEWQLSKLTEAAFIRYLLLDKSLAERYRKGELRYKQLQDLYQGLYSSSETGLACLPQMTSALRKDGKFNSCDEVLEKLVSSLELPSRRTLSHACIFNTAVPLAGLAAAAAIAESDVLAAAMEWQRHSLAYQVGSLWAIPPQVRFRQRSSLTPDEHCAAYKAAGDYLRHQGESGGCIAMGLSRLDCLLEARGHYLAAQDLENARAVTARISGYLERRDYYSELIRLNEDLLERETHVTPMNWIASAHLHSGNSKEAQKWFLRAVQVGPDAVSYHGLGTAYLLRRDFDLARDSFQREEEICIAKGDLKGQVQALQGLASVDMEKTEIDAALENLQRAADIQEQLGDQEGEAVTLRSMAMISLGSGDYDRAQQRLTRALELLQLTGDKTGIAPALFTLGSIDLEKGETQLAREEFQEALKLQRELGDRKGQADILHNLGLIETQAGTKEKAQELFIQALHIYQELGDKPGEAGAFFQLGAVAVQRNKMHEGLRLMALSAVVLRSVGSVDVKSVEPVVERLASQLNYSQAEFLEMVQEVVGAYRRDRGSALVDKATQM
jgi:tetratricopeptide (TPR) repeat protein